MKKILLSILLILLLIPYAAAAGSGDSADPDKTAENFINGLLNQDIELLMSAYHENADFVN